MKKKTISMIHNRIQIHIYIYTFIIRVFYLIVVVFVFCYRYEENDFLQICFLYNLISYAGSAHGELRIYVYKLYAIYTRTG